MQAYSLLCIVSVVSLISYVIVFPGFESSVPSSECISVIWTVSLVKEQLMVCDPPIKLSPK